MVHDFVASRWHRHVADARRFWRSHEFGIQVVAAIFRRLLDFDLNAVRVGERILACSCHLPGDFHVRLVGANAELVAADLGSHDGLRELSDHRELIAEIAVEGLEPIRQVDGRTCLIRSLLG